MWRTALSGFAGHSTYFVWLPLATSSFFSLWKLMEVYASVLPTVLDQQEVIKSR